MKKIIMVLLGLLIAGICHGQEMVINRVIQVTNQQLDQELVDFFPIADSSFWIVARESEIGKMRERSKVKIVQVIDGKVVNQVSLFEAKLSTNILSISKFTNNIVLVVLEDNKNITVFDFSVREGKVRTFLPKINIENGYIQSAVFAEKNANQIFISYIDGGTVKVRFMDYTMDKSIWENTVFSSDGMLGSIVDMININESLFLAGGVSLNAKVNGWLGKLDHKGELVWQKKLETGRAFFSKSLFDHHVDVVQESLKERKLSIVPVDSILDDTKYETPFLMSGYGAVTPKINRICDGQYFSIEKKSMDKSIFLDLSINKFTAKSPVVVLNKISHKVDNGTFINYLSKLAGKLFVGDSYVYVDSNRVLRSGIEINEISNLPSCASK